MTEWGFIQFAWENWEFVFIVLIPFAWNRLMSYKRKLLDEVYATKEELRTEIESVRVDVHDTIDEHAREDYQFQRELNDKMDANHNEIKNLIIRYLGEH